MVNLEVLISTMNQKDYSLIQKVNIQSDAIVINQCDRYDFKIINYKDYKISYYSFAERGIGLSRNNALMRSTSEICLFADDDITYVDGYRKLVIDAFSENPKADIVLFNVPSKNKNRPTSKIIKKKRIHWYNYQRYGAVNIAVRSEKIKQANIYFSLLFGGGAKYSSGEDTLFLCECIKKGLKIYASPKIIGTVSQDDSSWFHGYTEKYFFDKGVFFACQNKKWATLLALQYVIRHGSESSKEITRKEAFKFMLNGIKSAKRGWDKTSFKL